MRQLRKYEIDALVKKLEKEITEANKLKEPKAEKIIKEEIEKYRKSLGLDKIDKYIKEQNEKLEKIGVVIRLKDDYCSEYRKKINEIKEKFYVKKPYYSDLRDELVYALTIDNDIKLALEEVKKKYI